VTWELNAGGGEGLINGARVRTRVHVRGCGPSPDFAEETRAMCFAS